MKIDSLLVLLIILTLTGCTRSDVSRRIVTNLNDEWYFILDDDPSFSEGAIRKDDWEQLNIPHDWAFENGIKKGGAQGQGGGYHDGGVGWYRKYFDVQKESLNNITYINFDGVYMNSEVWINGEYLGKRPYGYISFRYDISDYLIAGKNTIAVRVDNSLEPSARWYHPCGIYAPVTLIEANPLHIAPNGIFVTTPMVRNNRASVNTEVKLLNKAKDESKLKIRTSILSEKGALIDSVSIIVNNVNAPINLELPVENPNLWSPDSPNLYQLRTEVISANEVVDEVVTTFGFRSVRWEAETGFWLNGENIKLKGVCEHWEGGPVGGAWTKPMLRWKLQLLKDMGINAIRPSHNPTPPMFYDICDEIGLLVMDEIFDGWHKKAPKDYGMQAFDEWWQRDMTEWITRDRNHPSIFVYSLGNETHSDIAPELVKFGRSLDSTRLFTSGSGNTEDMEIAGINGGSETQAFLENSSFDKPFISTEAPHTWQTRGYYRTQTWWRDNKLKNTYPLPSITDKEIFFYEWSDPKNWKNRKQHFNSSYDNATVRISARKNWEVMRDNPWHAGHFRWTGFDYYGEAGLAHGGLPFNLFMGGVIDVAGFRKDHYYFYQSQWTDKPMLHVLPSWTHPRMKKGTSIPVWVYSNADEIELILNGKSLGKDQPGTVWNEMQCEWMVPYMEGQLEAVAYNNGKEVVRKVINTSGHPEKLNNSYNKLPAEDEFEANYIITSEGVDKKGNFYPYAENKVYYKLEGDIEKISVENGNPIDSVSRTKSDYRNMFMGKVRLFVQEKNNAQKGSVTIGSILGDKSLYLSNRVSIDVSQIQLLGAPKPAHLDIYYTIDGNDPVVDGKLYTGPFEVSDATVVRSVVKRNDKVLFRMQESFGKEEGLFWGDEHSEDMWIGRGINIAAEEASLKGGARSSSDARRYKGDGFVRFDNKEGSIIWYQENDGEPGTYNIRFRYMHNDIGNLHPMNLIVNDKQIKLLEFKPTGGWEKEWRFVKAAVDFKSGANTIQLMTTGRSGPFIDELFID